MLNLRHFSIRHCEMIDGRNEFSDGHALNINSLQAVNKDR